MTLSGVRLSVRLGAAFLVIVVLMTIVGGYSISRMRALDTKVAELVSDKWPKTVMLNDVKGHINVIARALRNMILLDDTQEVKKEAQRVVDAREAIRVRLEELSKVVRSESGKAALKDVVAARERYVESQKLVLQLIESGSKEQAKQELMTSVRKSQSSYLAALDKMIEHQGKEMEQAGSESEALIRQALAVVIGLLATAILASLALAVVIVRSITTPVAELIAANERLANKDLSVVISLSGSDEIGRLADSSRKVVESLREIVGRVSDCSSQIASASCQLKSTAEQIATGAEEVACQTSTVATASEEMAATSGDIAQNCVRAADASRQSSDSATQGGAIVQETISGMARIAERVRNSADTVESLGARSEQIGNIIATIEDIADQTNLLALNAAIEAARAGEQGRGFAVVADEVRALAERTTRATKEIGAMIKAIQDETKAAVRAMEEGVAEVEKGTEFSQRSGTALEMILSQIGEVSMQINQIATAAEQQTATTSEITTNVQQVTEVVHHTARGANETASAASQLADNAQTLDRLMKQFRL